MLLSFRADGDKKMFVEAIIQPANLDRGKKTTDETRKQIKPFTKLCGCDQAGHTIARRLGGANAKFNLFPQNGNVSLYTGFNVYKCLFS